MSSPPEPRLTSYLPDASDTIIVSDLARFKASMPKPRDDNVYELIYREVFRQNSLAQKYIHQEQENFERKKASGWWTIPKAENDDQKDELSSDEQGEHYVVV